VTNADVLPLVSTDARVEEPRDMWSENLPVPIREAARRRTLDAGVGSTAAEVFKFDPAILTTPVSSSHLYLGEHRVA
jgi:hypothetical protein